MIGNKYKKVIQIALLSIVCIGLILFAKKKDANLRCNNVIVEFKNKDGANILKKEQVYNLITKFGKDPLEGKFISDINFTTLEKRVYKNSAVKKCEVYSDQSGDIYAKIETYLPIARVFDQNNNEYKFIEKSGKMFKIGSGYSPRVLIVDGSYFNKKDSISNTNIIELINKIDKSEFWNSEIAQMRVEGNGNISFVPQFGDHIIEFGNAENADKKFEKLKLFYNNVYSDKKYNKFKEISVKYRNQVVCRL